MLKMCHGWVQGLNYQNAFSLREDSWELGVVMWPIINFGYAMFNVYVEGGSYIHQVCLISTCFSCRFCGCGESC